MIIRQSTREDITQNVTLICAFLLIFIRDRILVRKISSNWQRRVWKLTTYTPPCIPNILPNTTSRQFAVHLKSWFKAIRPFFCIWRTEQTTISTIACSSGTPDVLHRLLEKTHPLSEVSVA